jgi:hypothetical protein
VTAAFRCSLASAERLEPIEGTASTVRSFLLVEAAGPWGVDAVRDCRMDDEVRQRLLHLERHHRVRPLLIRRHGRDGDRSGTRVFAAHVDRERPWLETARLDDVRELLDLDLAKAGEGRSPGLTPHEDPVFCVCTHGRHDVCCAERGRPVAAAMHAVAPGHTWEVSHIGGDRFAANVLVLPHGLYYGRLVPDDVPGFLESHLAGRLDLGHLRGRSSYPFPVQAAEVFLRRHLEAEAVAPPRLELHTREGNETRVVLALEGVRWEVRVRTRPAERHQLTCRAHKESAAPRHDLVAITRL